MARFFLKASITGNKHTTELARKILLLILEQIGCYIEILISYLAGVDPALVRYLLYTDPNLSFLNAFPLLPKSH